jgi:hypothetical protein
MAKYQVELIEPGKDSGVSQTERGYTEEELRKSLDTLDGTVVMDSSIESDTERVIGAVNKSWYDDGIVCIVEIFDDEYTDQLDNGVLSIAPAMTMETGDIATDISFERLFLASETTKLVGATERIE